MKVVIVIACYIVMGWVALLMTSWLQPFTCVGTVWKPAAMGYVLWTMAGFIDPFFPRGSVPSRK